jgi:hypothetical protein
MPQMDQNGSRSMDLLMLDLGDSRVGGQHQAQAAFTR